MDGPNPHRRHRRHLRCFWCLPRDWDGRSTWFGSSKSSVKQLVVQDLNHGIRDISSESQGKGVVATVCLSWSKMITVAIWGKGLQPNHQGQAYIYIYQVLTIAVTMGRPGFACRPPWQMLGAGARLSIPIPAMSRHLDNRRFTAMSMRSSARRTTRRTALHG